MNAQSYTLRPGYLVALSTSVRGNTRYQTVQLESTHLTDDGQLRARWETTRVVADPDEQERAAKVRSRARNLLQKVCTWSAFGLLCPEDKLDELREAVAEAHAMVDAFNRDAKLTRVNFNVIYGRIARDDMEAVQAISGEIRQLMDDMTEGLQRLDVKAVRAAANNARLLGQMLDGEAKAANEAAIKAARAEATKIVKAGEQVAQKIDENTLKTIQSARTGFLDMEGSTTITVPAVFDRGIDMEAGFDDTSAQVSGERRTLDLEEVK